MEDAIARAVAGHVEGRSEPSPATFVTSETPFPDAHLLLLQGHGLASRGTAAAQQQAVERYRAAAQRDTTYAQAYASLALASAVMSSLQLSTSSNQLADIAANANRAIELDSSRAEAYAAIGFIHAVQGANHEAEAEFRRALARDSSLAVAWGWFGVLASHVGDYSTGHERVLRARTLEPASALPRAWDALVYFGEHNYERAEQVTRSIPQIDSTITIAVQTHAQSLLSLSQDSAALALLDVRVGDDGDSEATALHAYAAVRAGHEEQAREILLALRDASRGALPARATLAATLGALGDVDSAIGILKAAVARRDPALFFFSRTARFDQLRKDPRGAALLGQVERW